MTLEELQLALAEAQANLAIQQQELASAQSNYNSQSEVVLQLQSELTAKQIQLDNATITLNEYQLLVQQETQDVLEAEAAVDAAQAAVDSYVPEDDVTLEELQAALAAAQEELALQQAELDAAVLLRDQQLQELNDLTAQIAQLQSDINELQAQLTALNEAVSATQTEYDQQLVVVEQETADVVTAQENVDAAQAALDAYQDPVDPDPDPEPDPEPLPAEIDPYPVFIEGQQVSFRTNPPENVTVRQHPRFLVPGREDEIRAKLTDPAWAFERNRMNGAILWALQYAINGNIELGVQAKNALLNQDGIQNNPGSDWYINWLLVYDWCHDLFTQEEREQAFAIMCGEAGLSVPAPGSVEFEVVGVQRNTQKGNGNMGFFGNDVHEPSNHANGVQFRGLIGVAFHGDGVRDEWCDYIVDAMMHQTDGRIYGVFDPLRGGVLDLHNALALNSGGCQAGDHGELTPITGYNSMFFNSCARFLACCETAFGLELFRWDNFYRKAPHWILYRGGEVGTNEGLQVFSMLTGIYKNIDPETAGLAAYVCQQHGTGKYYEAFALCCGDRSIQPITPSQAGLPETDLRDGDDFWVSRNRWEKPYTEVELTTRTIDANRYENDLGLLRITSGGEKLVISGQAKKGSRKVIYGSGIWIWRSDKAPETQQGNTYWSNRHLRGLGDPNLVVERCHVVWDAMTKRGYRGKLPTETFGNDQYGLCTIDAGWFAIEGERNLQVNKNKRTVVHIKPDVNGREFVVCYDRVVMGDDDQLKQCWGIRVGNRPVITDNKFLVTENTKSLHGTMLTPGTFDLRGGQYAASSVWDEMTSQLDDISFQINNINDQIKKTSDPTLQAALQSQKAELQAQYAALAAERWELFRITEGPNGESYHKSGYIFTDVNDGRGQFGDYALFIKPNNNMSAEYCVVFEIGDTGFTPVEATMNGKVVSVGGHTVDFSVEDNTLVNI